MGFMKCNHKSMVQDATNIILADISLHIVRKAGNLFLH